MSEHRETRWFRGIILFFAILTAIVSFFNILYYNRLRHTPSTILLPISYTTITIMWVANLLIFILALIVAFWSIFRLVEPTTGAVVPVVVAKPDCTAKLRDVTEAKKVLAEKTREYNACAGPAYTEPIPAPLREELGRRRPRRYEEDIPLRSRPERTTGLEREYGLGRETGYAPPRDQPLGREGYGRGGYGARPVAPSRTRTPIIDPLSEGY